MKLFFAIMLMFTVLYSELSSILELANVDISHIDTSYEGEAEKESTENVEEVSKVKFRQEINLWLINELTSSKDISLRYAVSTPYLEIHSPPPDLS